MSSKQKASDKSKKEYSGKFKEGEEGKDKRKNITMPFKTCETCGKKMKDCIC